MSSLASFFSLLKRNISICIYFPIALLLKIFNIKVPFFNVDRIGHLLVEPDCFIKEFLLKQKKIPIALFLAPKNQVANLEVIKQWKKYFIIIQNPIVCRVLMPLAFHPIISMDTKKYAAVHSETATSFIINNKWGTRKSLFSLSEEENRIGSKILNEIGVSDSDWFVCIHNRESGYDKYQSPDEKVLHDFRNFPCSDFYSAVDYICSMGGVCIRMGDNNMTPVSYPGIIDYALNPLRSDFMDLYIASRAKFFLGSTSGAANLSMVFGVPIAAVNITPITSATMGHKDLFIPMLIRDKKSNELVSFKDIFSSPISNYRIAEDWYNSNFILEKNTPKDILELVKEIFERIEGCYKEDSEAALLCENFKLLFTDGHYGYGTASKIGDHFVKKYS